MGILLTEVCIYKYEPAWEMFIVVPIVQLYLLSFSCAPCGTIAKFFAHLISKDLVEQVKPCKAEETKHFQFLV
jgi:hypothetical protein